MAREMDYCPECGYLVGINGKAYAHGHLCSQYKTSHNLGVRGEAIVPNDPIRFELIAER